MCDMKAKANLVKRWLWELFMNDVSRDLSKVIPKNKFVLCSWEGKIKLQSVTSGKCYWFFTFYDKSCCGEDRKRWKAWQGLRNWLRHWIEPADVKCLQDMENVKVFQLSLELKKFRGIGQSYLIEEGLEKLWVKET